MITKVFDDKNVSQRMFKYVFSIQELLMLKNIQPCRSFDQPFIAWQKFS